MEGRGYQTSLIWEIVLRGTGQRHWTALENTAGLLDSQERARAVTGSKSHNM